eukprot:5052373-Prymnesium_polylepis.1
MSIDCTGRQPRALPASADVQHGWKQPLLASPAKHLTRSLLGARAAPHTTAPDTQHHHHHHNWSLNECFDSKKPLPLLGVAPDEASDGRIDSEQRALPGCASARTADALSESEPPRSRAATRRQRWGREPHMGAGRRVAARVHCAAPFHKRSPRRA